MTVKLEDTIYLHIGTSSPTTGAATNADTPPTVTIEEDGVALGYSPTPANVAVGLYRVTIVASAANGFEAGRRYSVYAVAAVNSITGRDGIAEFEVVARGLDDLAPEAGGNIATIMGKTNALPSDPADESLLEAAIATRAAPGDAMLLTGAYDAAKTAAQAGDAMALTSAYEAAKTAAAPGAQMALTGAEETAIATAVLTQDITNMQATAAKPSLVSVILHAVSRVRRITGKIQEFRLDGTTVHIEHDITTQGDLLPINDISVGH
jgi:hypothetical protein